MQITRTTHLGATPAAQRNSGAPERGLDKAAAPSRAAAAAATPLAAKPLADSFLGALVAAQAGGHAKAVEAATVAVKDGRGDAAKAEHRPERVPPGHAYGHARAPRWGHGPGRGHGHGRPPVPPPAAEPPPVVSPPPVAPPPPVVAAPPPAPPPVFRPTAGQIATPRIVDVVRRQLTERAVPIRRDASAREQAYLAAARTQREAAVKLAAMRQSMQGQAALALLAAGQAQLLSLQPQPRPYAAGRFI